MAAITATPETEQQEYRPGPDRERLSDLLNELFPEGLTDDAPIRKARIVAAIRAGEL